jgi:hypothetical protein
VAADPDISRRIVMCEDEQAAEALQDALSSWIAQTEKSKG